jgi:hypothetical protein
MRWLPLALTTLSLWGLAHLSPAVACDLVEPGSTDYGLQDDNRCEGVRDRVSVSGSLDLISLTSTQGGSLGRSLNIRVPYIANTGVPYFLMQEIEFRYALDNLPFRVQGRFHRYSLASSILTRIGVDSIDDLRAIAVSGSQRVYLPTILGQDDNSYRFVFYSVDSVRFLEAGIRRGNSVSVSWGPQGARRGEKAFEWTTAADAPAGRYEFYYEAEIQQGNRPAERISRRLPFEHDPRWLR